MEDAQLALLSLMIYQKIDFKALLKIVMRGLMNHVFIGNIEILFVFETERLQRINGDISSFLEGIKQLVIINHSALPRNSKKLNYS
jgi:hypothetical protein